MQLENDASKCTQCSSCGSVCPVVRLLPAEATSPRGRLYFLQVRPYLSEAERKIVEPLFYQAVFVCTTCGQCQEICSSDVNLLDIWKQERS